MPENPNPKSREPLAPPTSVTPCELAYVELDVTTNFSFLRGASHPDEMVYTAAELGYRAIAITDRNTLAGAVRAHAAARSCGMRLIVGARLTLTDCPDLLVWAPDRAAYASLCRILTFGKQRVGKGEFQLSLQEFLELEKGLLVGVDLAAQRRRDEETERRSKESAASPFDNHFVSSSLRRFVSLRDRLSLILSQVYGPDDLSHLDRMLELSRQTGIPLLATNAVHYHDPNRRELQDVLTCIRHGCTIQDAGFRLFPNGERYLKSPAQMHALFDRAPQAIARAVEIASRCTFRMDELRYEYPDELVPDGFTAMEFLKKITWEGARKKFSPLPPHIRHQVDHELKLIEDLKFEAYFLTVYDLVKFARSRGILCQGRGSAANSAVCYCIGVTSVDPSKIDLLFERFISRERNEPPDIDIDFEHERREEVIQYVYQKYGRDRSGMCATLITYRGRSAIRDVGKAMGLSLDQVDSLARRLDWWHRGTLDERMIKDAGVDPRDPTVRRVITLTAEVIGFPRHLGQHTGGMIMTRGLLCELVPIENASMENRTVVEWDKDDVEELGLLKVDVLGLGMLSCIGKAFRMLEEETERPRDEETKWITQEEPTNGKGTSFSGVDCVAEVDGVGADAIHRDKGDAARRAVRIDSSDAPGGDLRSFQHRRGIWPSEPPGSAEVPANCSGLTQRVDNPASTGMGSEDDAGTSSNFGLASRNGSSPSRPDPQSGPQVTDPLRLSVSPSLRLSVPLSPCPSVPLRYELHTVPPDDPAVYDMICDADTIGVFQIESRAQMSMLPRLRPRTFYDLVIEVAIVRPGPIQGNMVHPYLRRRCGEESVTYPSEALKNVLHKTLGVPLFQEQAMKVAMVAAGFSAGEADQLRRAMAAWRKSGAIMAFHRKIIDGMLRNGYTLEFAENTFKQIQGFGEYGFPESHSASFSLLVYVSAWLKRHHPAVFCAAILNSQPMGFYAPAQLVRDAREHGVEVRCVDVNKSGWDCSLEEATEARRHEGMEGGKECWGLQGPAVRLGFRQIKGFREEYARRIVAARCEHGTFASVEQFHQATHLPASAIQKLAEADAFGSLSLSRRQSIWEALELDDAQQPLFDHSTPSLHLSVSPSLLPPMPLGQEIMTDYRTTTLSLKAHPLSLLRAQFAKDRIVTASQIASTPAGKWVKVAGLVLVRQRPGTASGIVFFTLEDETGTVNLIVRPDIWDRYRAAARHAGLLQCDGYLERKGQVIHIMAKRLFDRSEMLSGFELTSRDFH